MVPTTTADTLAPGAPEPSPISEKLTYAQAAKFLNVSINTLYYWVHTKKIHHVRYSPRMVRFERTALEEWIKSHRINAIESGG